MPILTRRNFVKSAAMASTLPLLGRGAFADEPLKVGYIYLGPVGDFGWTWAHEKGRKAMVDHFGGKVVADYVENVNEDASATPVIKDLAAQGHKLIFTTSFGYMDQTLEVAKEYPDAKFEHCTGYKHADNVATYNNRFHEGRAVHGHDRRHDDEDRRDRISRLVQGSGSRDGRELVRAGRAGGEAEHQGQAYDDRFLVRSGQGGGRGGDARQPRLRRHRHAYRQPAALQVSKRRRSTASARAPTCRASRRMRI